MELLLGLIISIPILIYVWVLKPRLAQKRYQETLQQASNTAEKSVTQSPLQKEIIEHIQKEGLYSCQKKFGGISFTGTGFSITIVHGLICRQAADKSYNFYKVNNLRSEPFCFAPHPLQASIVINKKKSVTGSAIAGGILAGSAGAVVGAVRAADINSKGGTQKVHSQNTGEYALSISGVPIKEIWISEQIIEKFGFPDFIDRNREWPTRSQPRGLNSDVNKAMESLYRVHHGATYYFETGNTTFSSVPSVSYDRVCKLIEYVEATFDQEE